MKRENKYQPQEYDSRNRVLGELADDVKGSLLNLAGVVTAIGQLAFLGELLRDDTPATKIYVVCIALFCAMSFLSVRSFLKARSLSRYSRKRQIYTGLFLLYTALALLALFPAGYRWAYVHTDWLPSDGEPGEIDPGSFLGGIIVKADASGPQLPLEINMYLDPLRTSFQCSKTRGNQREREETFSLNECAEYSIPEYRLLQIKNGHGIDEDDAEEIEVARLNSQMMASAYQALKVISNYRGTQASLLERGPVIIFLFSQNPRWQKKLLVAGLLPNAKEWERLTREHPGLARELRKFLIEWVGFLDPFFHVSFRNPSANGIEISRIKYTASPRRGGIQATLLGAYDNPRYLVELQEGTHEIEILPPIQVPSKGVEEIDLLLRLKKPDPGVTYDIKLEFISENPANRIALPKFGITFMRER